MTEIHRAGFADHFSNQAKDYSIYRPSYPDSLFDQILAETKSRSLAWDCGCGNGQASQTLVNVFDKVVATDPSANQIENASPHPKIQYLIAPAEKVPQIKDQTVDLICVAQAMHWFNFELFRKEAYRVGKRGSTIAAWGYALSRVDSEIDALYDQLYDDILKDYWPKERVLIEAEYRTIPFDFADKKRINFDLETFWNRNEYLGYLRTWSATQKYLRANGTDPVSLIEKEMERVWPDDIRKRVVYPGFLLLGKIE